MSSTLSVDVPGRNVVAPPDGGRAWRRLRAAARRFVCAIRRLPTLLMVQWHRVPFERLFWIGFVVLLLLFALLLVVQPTGAGRGGR
jgi:hypothetical protein